jgi:hypothetical protein
MLERRHKDQQRGGCLCRLIAGATDHLCEGSDLFIAHVVSVGFEALQVRDDVFAGICTTHEFSKPGVIRFQSVPDNRATLSIDRFVI